MSCINDYLRGERGEWLPITTVARTLTALGATTSSWPKMTYGEWYEAIEAAMASGEVEVAYDAADISIPIIRYREPKPKKETVVQKELF